LVVTLELIAQDDPIDAVAALGQALRFPQIRAKDLDVVLDVLRFLPLRVERLLA
jgi:hypothetical protein